jgi:glycosyltransferase involved in cell wall biosynthesis
MGSRVMNIEIIFPFPFPIGLSPANRLITYAKGLAEQNNQVKVIIIRPTEPKLNIINKETRGAYLGITYEYSWHNTILPSNKYWKILLMAVSISKSILLVYKDYTVKRIDCLISTCDSGILNIAFYLLAKFIKCKFIYIADEYPFPIRYGREPNLLRKISINYSNKLFDGLIVMTRVLEKYFSNKVSKAAKVLLMPMTVECERFTDNKDISPISGNYIGYIGDLGYNKDGVENLIESFYLISNCFPNLKLCIIGSAKEKNIYNKFNQLIFNHNLKERVILTGRLYRDLVPSYLNNASLLALARPDTLRSQGGFPTKLGEYLSSGRPVVCTAVGEIPDYLTDGENAFLVKPDNNDEFAEKLKYVLNNPGLAEKVGRKGRELALNVFNYKVQSKRMNEFLQSIC